MGHAHAAAHRHVPPLDGPIRAHVGHEPDVVGEDVHVVVRRHRDHDLELARQVGRPEHRLLLRPGHLLLADPDLVPRPRLRQQPVAEVMRQPQRRRMGRPGMGVHRRHHIAVHVAARRDGVQQGAVHRLDRRAQIALQDAVELHGLPRRQPDRAVAALPGDLVQRQPLLRRDLAPGDAQPRHEAVGGLHPLAAPLGAQVAVVLLVDAVELRELRVVLVNGARLRHRQAMEDAAAQQVAARLDPLVLGLVGLRQGPYVRVRHQYTSSK